MNGQRILFALLALVLVAAPLAAQEQTGVTGVVKDSDGGVLPGVTVTVKNVGTGLTRPASSSRDGRFTVSGLPPGKYMVTAELQGFANYELKDLTLVVGSTVPLNVVLKPAGLETTVTVTGERTIIQTTESDVSTAVSKELIENLPIAERNAITLALLTPGVSASPYFDPTKSRDNFDGFGFGAASASSTQTLVDGADNNDNVVGSILQFYPQESIREFEVIASRFKAEYGHTDGGVVNMITKSGENDLSGGGYWLFRDKSLNKKTFVEEASGSPKGDFRQNVSGAYLGGPIMKDTLFFFGNGDYTKRPQQLLPNTNGVIPQIDAQGQLPHDFKQTLALGKITANLGKSNFFTGRYAYQDDATANVNASASTTAAFGGEGSNRYHAFLLKNQTVIGNDKLNEAFWQFNRFKNAIVSNADGTPEERRLNRIAGQYFLGQNLNHPQLTTQDKHQFVDTFSWHSTFRGDHDFKAGFEYQKVKVGGQFSTGETFVRFSWNTAADFLAGRAPANARVWNGPLFFVGESENTILAGYLQDDWKVTDRLTFNLGLRYDIETNDWTQASDKSRLGPGRTFISADPAFFGGQPQTDKNNFGPRAGFAYDVEGTGKFVVRGGWGLYYQQIFWNSPIRMDFAEGDLGTTQLSTGAALNFGPNDPFCAAGQSGPGCIPFLTLPRPVAEDFLGSDFTAADPRIKTPYKHQFSAGFSTAIPGGVALDADFVRTVSNQEIYITSVAGRTTVNGLSTVNMGANTAVNTQGARQSYSGLLMSARKQVGKLTSQLSYTFGLAKGHIGRQTSAITDDRTDHFNDNFGYLGSSRKHLFAGSIFYNLPYELQVGAVLKFQSGFSFTAIDSSLGDLDGDAGEGDSIADVALGSPAGHGKVGEFRGDSFSQVDLRLAKKFTLAGHYRPQVFFEIFNLFNSANEKPDGVVNDINDANFGTSNDVAGQPFQAQLSVRLDF